MGKRYIEISKLPNFEVTTDDGQKFVLLPFEHLSDIPTVDAVEVVRCENCIHSEFVNVLNEVNGVTYKLCCMLTGFQIEYNGFCDYGELKE